MGWEWHETPMETDWLDATAPQRSNDDLPGNEIQLRLNVDKKKQRDIFAFSTFSTCSSK